MGAHRRPLGFPRPDGGEQAAAISQRNHDCTFAVSLWAITIFERGHERPVLMLTLHQPCTTPSRWAFWRLISRPHIMATCCACARSSPTPSVSPSPPTTAIQPDGHLLGPAADRLCRPRCQSLSRSHGQAAPAACGRYAFARPVPPPTACWPHAGKTYLDPRPAPSVRGHPGSRAGPSVGSGLGLGLGWSWMSPP